MAADDLATWLRNLIKRIYELQDLPESIDEEITRYFADSLVTGIIEGFGQDLDEADFESPDQVMLQALVDHTWQFSAAKNYSQMRSLTEALTDENGRLRSFNEFKAVAEEINADYVGAWLKAEYNFAVAGAQMSRMWLTIEQDKDIFPYLKYRTAGDEKVRLEHELLDGFVRKVDDSIWDILFPPNGWGCRCDVEQMASARETPLDQIVIPDRMPDMFKVNLGKQRLAFPPSHPYFKGLPDEMREQGRKLKGGKE